MFDKPKQDAAPETIHPLGEGVDAAPAAPTDPPVTFTFTAEVEELMDIEEQKREAPNETMRDIEAMLAPRGKTSGSIGFDLHCRKPKIAMAPGQARNVPTGVYTKFAPGYFGMIVPRSGLSSQQVVVLNSPGTIDPDYEGEIQVLLMNLSGNAVIIELGQAVAQLIPMQAMPASPEVGRVRGTGGFGSTDEPEDTDDEEPASDENLSTDS